MKNVTYTCLLASMLLLSTQAFAENRAVNIVISNDGAGLDSTSLPAARKIIGQAIVSDSVDSFIVYVPREGSLFREGGLSACAEAGFSTTPKKFNAFVQRLRAIHPKQGTFVNIELVSSCKPIEPCKSVEPLSCGGFTGKACPTDLVCVDDPKDSCDPTHGGADCSGICVANPKLTCGGITGKPCPGDQACIDDPKDSCDPAHGGADCSGVCVAKPK